MNRKTFKFPKLTPAELGYIAGFIDGDGTLQISIRWNKDRTPRKCQYSVEVRNTDPRSLEFIHRKLNPSWKLSYCRSNRQMCLYFQGKDRVREFLTNIKPYLILKKEQAEIMLQLIKQHKPRAWSISDWELVLKHSLLNKADVHPKRLNKIKDLKQFVEKSKF